MTSDTAVWLLGIAVALSSIGLITQAIAAMGMYRTLRQLRDRLEPVATRAGNLADSAEQTLADSRKQITEVTTKANEVLDLARSQLTRMQEQMGVVEDVLKDASARVKAKMDRAEAVLDETMDRVSDTVHSVQSGVTRPVREIAGIVSGVRAALRFLLAGPRPSVAQATQDEEMFI